MPPKRNDPNGEARGFAKDKACGGSKTECAEEFRDQAGIHAASGGMNDEADHQALEGEENGKVCEGDRLHANHAAKTAEGL